MAITMSELLGVQKDAIEDCRQKVRALNDFDSRSRILAEIILKDGSRRVYRAKSSSKCIAIQEIITFVKAIEENIESSVMWRLKGEKTYQMGANYNAQPSLMEKVKKGVLNLFELE